MKRFVLMFAFLLACSGLAQAEEKTYPGPQEGAPNVYHQIFENEKVRISEISFEPGEKAAMHTHAYPHAVYVLEGGTLNLTYPDGTSKSADAKAGDVLWFPAETHEAVNTGSTVVRAIVTEIK